jgi:hypothetical protein
MAWTIKAFISTHCNSSHRVRRSSDGRLARICSPYSDPLGEGQMSNLSLVEQLAVSFVPPVFMVGLLAAIVWRQMRATDSKKDGPARLLAVAVRALPEGRSDWHAAMLAELDQVSGRRARWTFALGCAWAAIFPPRVDEPTPRILHSLPSPNPVCGSLSVVLPSLAMPLLYVTALACDAFMEHDDFSSGELVPTILGACIVSCLVCMMGGLPLGIAGLIRRERCRWLSCLGPFWSIGVFSYVQLVQYVAANHLG